MSKPIRIGIIGAGGNTRARHIPGLRGISGVELAAVCNRSRESGERSAKEFGIPQVTEDWREIVAAADIDAVCIGTWPNTHAEISIAALHAGKHVLTEARMARDLTEAEAMLAESRRHPHLVAQIVPAPMSLPFDATVRDLLAAGELGELREVLPVCTNAAAADAAVPMNFRFDHVLSGRNTMFMGIYYEMVLRWLGEEPDWVQADAAIFTSRRRDGAGKWQEVRVPESLVITGRYASGARLGAHFSGVETSAPRAEIRLNGGRAGLRLDLTKGELWLARRGEAEKKIEIAPEKRGVWQVEADFIASIREGRPVRLTDFGTGVDYMRFTEAVWDSWTDGGARVELARYRRNEKK